MLTTGRFSAAQASFKFSGSARKDQDDNWTGIVIPLCGRCDGYGLGSLLRVRVCVGARLQPIDLIDRKSTVRRRTTSRRQLSKGGETNEPARAVGRRISPQRFVLPILHPIRALRHLGGGCVGRVDEQVGSRPVHTPVLHFVLNTVPTTRKNRCHLLDCGTAQTMNLGCLDCNQN